MHRLQELVDRRYGKHHINVRTDYIGAHSGDADPWYWMNARVGSLWIRLVKSGSHHDVVGWYFENGDLPVLPQGGGVLFGEHCRVGDEAVVTLKFARTPFGFYLDSGRSEGDAGDGDDDSAGGGPAGGERFFTNRQLNDAGPGGPGSSHRLPGGDIQALVFDVSRWAGGEAWLVCFEDRDSGGRGGRRYFDSADDDPDDELDHQGPGRAATDNDFADVVFEVRDDNATPAHSISFGALKLRYR